jgi:hypothetical protein
MSTPPITILHATGKTPRPTAAPRGDLRGRSVTHGTTNCGAFPNLGFTYYCTYPYGCAIDTANNVEGCCDVSQLDQCIIATTCLGLANYAPGDEYTQYWYYLVRLKRRKKAESLLVPTRPIRTV